MNSNPNEFRERLLAAEKMNPTRKYQEELHMLIEQKLTPAKKWAFRGSLALGIGFTVIFGSAAVWSPREFPGLGRAGFILGAVFGLAWAVLVGWILQRGSINRRKDPTAMTGLVWGFTVVMITLFMLLGGQLSDRVIGIQMVVNGLVFLVMAVAFLLRNVIEQSELRTREKLLELECRLADISETLKAVPRLKSSASGHDHQCKQ